VGGKGAKQAIAFFGEYVVKVEDVETGAFLLSPVILKSRYLVRSARRRLPTRKALSASC
jgi:hypothetical protein